MEDVLALLRVGAGLIGAWMIASAACRAGWLADGRAVAAATAVGGSIFAFAGWQGALLLVAFFLSAGLLSRLPDPWLAQKPAEAGRGGPLGPAGEASAPRRTAVQVAANGGVAAAAAVAVGLTGATWARFALAGAIAAATADTWATEVGRWWRATPRSALSGRPLEPGESGGMTAAGTFAAMLGAAFIGLLAAGLWPDLEPGDALLIEVAGFAGMWVDSVLGATVQYKAYCSACGRVVEERRHPHETDRRQGFSLIDNHAVNVAATLAGALAGLYLSL